MLCALRLLFVASSSISSSVQIGFFSPPNAAYNSAPTFITFIPPLSTDSSTVVLFSSAKSGSTLATLAPNPPLRLECLELDRDPARDECRDELEYPASLLA